VSAPSANAIAPATSASEPAAEAEPEGDEQTLEQSAVRAQHEPEAGVHDAGAGRGRRLGGRLPLAADVGEKPRAGRARLVEDLVAAVAVVADGRRAHERGYRPQSRDGLGDEPGA
jgi:hypothetical protein